MIDPTTASAVISGLVTSLTSYMTYRVNMKKAEYEAKAPTEKPDNKTMEQGEAGLAVIEQGIKQHGTPDEQTALMGFQQNPTMFRPVLEDALRSLAVRSPEFAQQLQSLAQQANIQLGGIQGTVNVSGQGKVYGNAFGVVHGNVEGGTYNVNEHDDS